MIYVTYVFKNKYLRYLCIKVNKFIKLYHNIISFQVCDLETTFTNHSELMHF